jgi:hypothetical protein
MYVFLGHLHIYVKAIVAMCVPTARRILICFRGFLGNKGLKGPQGDRGSKGGPVPEAIMALVFGQKGEPGDDGEQGDNNNRCYSAAVVKQLRARFDPQG